MTLGDEAGETSTFDLDLHNAETADLVDQILKDNGISNVTYRFYDNDGGYSYSSDQLDYDRARKETKGGKNCKLGVVIGGKLVRMVPFPLSPVDPSSPPQAPPQQYNTSDMLFMKELMLKLVENRTATPAPAAPTITELTSALANLDTLRTGKDNSFESFKAGLEFAKDIVGGGSGDWKTDALRTIEKVAPQVLGAVQSFRGGVPLPPNPGGEPEMIPTQPDQMPPKEIILAGLAYMKKKAVSGLDPEFAVDWIENNAEEYEAILRVVLNQEFSYFVELDPQIASEPYASWFANVFNGLRSRFSGEDTVDDDSGRDTGNGGNPGSNGKSSEGGSDKPVN